MEVGGVNMDKWKSEVADFIVEHYNFIEKVNESLQEVKSELRDYFQGSEFLMNAPIEVEVSDDKSKPEWTMKIGHFIINFDMERLRQARTTQDESGLPLLDESITVNDAIKTIILNRLNRN